MLQEFYGRELNYKAEVVIMNEHSLVLCENNIMTRAEELKLNLNTEHEDIKELCLSGDKYVHV